MSKLYKNPIQVNADSNGMPVEFYWYGRSFQVTHCSIIVEKPSMLEPWKKTGTWYRCETKQGLSCDLTRDNFLGWILERVWD